jgi:hypothetical protein
MAYHGRRARQQGPTGGLGYRYFGSDGVPKNIDTAIKWLKLAAAQGHKDSIDNLEIATCIKEKRCDDTGDPPPTIIK